MLRTFVDAVYRKSPFQKKKLEPFLANAGPEFWARGDEFAVQFNAYLEAVGLNVDYAVDAYLKMCKDFLTEQTKFLRTGVYSRTSQGDAFEHVYSDDREMRSYMVGLALSQFLWETHYAMYSFILETFEQKQGRVRRYLEVGPGHGMFLAGALNRLRAQHYTAVDISPISIDVCKGFLPFIAPSAGVIDFQMRDVVHLDESESFDFIMMGQVIEHLDDPGPILRSIHRLLAPGGSAILTTCANCPSIDHVYLFRHVSEIRDLLQSCGFRIVDERVLPVEKMSEADQQLHKVCVNYAALVEAV